MKIRPGITEKQVRAYCEGCFYSILEGKRKDWVPWEPFEHYDREWLEEQIDNMVESLTHYLEGGK